jgi:predicted nucleic acid-binding protein
MATLYLLDTNILVHPVRRDAVGERIRRLYSPLLTEPRPLISVVTEGELRSLGFQLGWGKEKTEQSHYLLTYFQRTTIETEEVLQAYALIDTFSERLGRSMGKNDLWIAATAHVTGATLLTTDRDFDHLEGQFLKREWVDPFAEKRSST